MSDVATEYVVEYVDGPLEGTAERRYLVRGEYDKLVSAYAAIDGIESQFQYKAVDSREVQGELHVRYSFDASDSDPYESDPEDDPSR
ncbi:hypothetical protein [Humibacter ginsenosidimutans]|uniref:Uncharacterized protein n=1 Tax=Humibacter ginsenosidimutans TaxID=2599293 RepID=A0A5B8M198_9MICO|nr:hypothetical protein [Humibacter ginsenosidimutans]QDZ14046.1 hypothetical protein FPZ11_03965 [Humibacter ginsenosidimutans]